METIKPGMNFMNGIMSLEVIDFTETTKKNLALLLCLDDGLFITARDLTYEGRDRYSWCWGHYYKNKKDAVKDYKTRLNDL